jgi:hypothetical protein
MSRARLYSILIIAMILALVPWIFVSLCGSLCVDAVASVPARLVLFLLIEALLLLGIVEYYINFAPYSALRSTRSCLRLCKICLTGSATIPGGLFLAGKANLLGGVEFYAQFEDAGWTSVVSLAVSLAALYFFNDKYLFLRLPTNRRWAERE